MGIKMNEDMSAIVKIFGFAFIGYSISIWLVHTLALIPVFVFASGMMMITDQGKSTLKSIVVLLVLLYISLFLFRIPL